MLEVELDIFSGMPNPTWILSEKEEQALIERLDAGSAPLADGASNDQLGLGYRGLIVRHIKSDGRPTGAHAATRIELPHEFRVGDTAATLPAAQWLLKTSEKAHKHSQVSDAMREIAAAGVSLVHPADGAADPVSTQPADNVDPASEFSRFPTMPGEGADSPDGCSPSADMGVRSASWWNCPSNTFLANAATFNRPANVGRNNCYCFASNHLAGVRYALPGRRGGRPATSITCSGVIAGLYADGWKDGCQQNGLTIVLVIWPGQDYHFYRLVTGGPNWWWGHKPGGTPAKYTDDCGNSLYQVNGRGYAPNNCCRGPYTDFCGYFYQNNSTAFVA